MTATELKKAFGRSNIWKNLDAFAKAIEAHGEWVFSGRKYIFAGLNNKKKEVHFFHSRNAGEVGVVFWNAKKVSFSEVYEKLMQK